MTIDPIAVNVLAIIGAGLLGWLLFNLVVVGWMEHRTRKADRSVDRTWHRAVAERQAWAEYLDASHARYVDAGLERLLAAIQALPETDE